MRKILTGLVFLLALIPARGRSQGPAWNLDKGYLFHVSYGPFFSAGDLSDRFGNGFAIGGGVDLTPANSRWQYGIMAQDGFGSTVKEDVLAGIRTDAGFIIGNQRQPAEVLLRQRQLFLGPRVGRTIPLGANPRAGLQLTTGLGYFFSRIRFQPDPVQYVPQIDPARHRLVVHGLVRQPLSFDVKSLLRYPMRSRMLFIECGGNSNAGWHARAISVRTGSLNC